MTASEDLPGAANSLLPKLQTKLVVLPGVINTQQLHRHYTSHNATANRLLQRLAIPEQLTAHYTSGVLQPEAMRSRYQRFQRTESFGGSESLVSVSVVQRLPESGFQDEGTRGQGESFSTNFSASLPPIINHSAAATPPGIYRISRQTTALSNSVNAIAKGDSFRIADSTTTVTGNPNVTANPIQAKMQPQAERYSDLNAANTTQKSAIIQQKYGQSEGLQSSSDSTSALFRVARKTVENFTPPAPSPATGIEGLETAISPNPTSATSTSDIAIQRKYQQRELLWRVGSDGVTGGANTSTAATPASNSTEEGTKNSLTPQTAITLQRKYHQSELLWRVGSDGVTGGANTSTAATPASNSTEEGTKNSLTPQTAITLQRKYHQSELLLRPVGSDGVTGGANTSTAATPASNSTEEGTKNSLTPQTVVTLQRKYHQSELLLRPSQDTTGLLTKAVDKQVFTDTNNHQINTDAIAMPFRTESTVPARVQLIQRQVTEDSVDNRGDSRIQNRLDLPLAISSNQNSVLVSRQTTNASEDYVPTETIRAIPIPTAPTTLSPANSDVDVEEIAEQVSRIILRRLVVERERGGMGR